jgi:hypothetical protein
MKLSEHVLSLFFESENGATLTAGFEELVGLSLGDVGDIEDDDPNEASSGPSDEGSAQADAAADGDDALGESAEEKPAPSPAAQARMALDACFEHPEIIECVFRTLGEVEQSPPESFAEAHAVYSQLLDAGLTILGKDVDALFASNAWFYAETSALQTPDEDAEDEDDGADEEDAEDGGDDSVAVGPAGPEEEDDEELLRIGGKDDDGRKIWAERIGPISWALHCFAPEWFVPYAFVHRFHQFEAICDEFDIPLPRLPGKASTRERAAYYLELNESLQEFRRSHEMDPDQFNAFLYGFCSAQVPVDELPELPPAQRAWFLMANPDTDFDPLDHADDESRHHWQGSNEIRPGDICVMWCRSPRSSVHSIWRATSRGFADPFFFYYRTVWIGHARKVPPVSFRELQSDPTWGAKPATRAHFQNSSGKEVTFEEYEALLRLLNAKGCDLSELPTLERNQDSLPEDLENESDVEEKLLEPLLARLGYKATDWVRQLSVRMGRGERVYPDYAFGVSGGRGEESAKMIVEAKFRITTDKQRREAYLQARSYAERLRADVLLLCAVDGLWIFQRGRDGFDGDHFLVYSWAKLGEAKEIRAVEDLVGKASGLWRKKKDPR